MCVRGIPRGENVGRMCVYALADPLVVGGEDACVYAFAAYPEVGGENAGVYMHSGLQLDERTHLGLYVCGCGSPPGRGSGATTAYALWLPPRWGEMTLAGVCGRGRSRGGR